MNLDYIYKVYYKQRYMKRSIKLFSILYSLPYKDLKNKDQKTNTKYSEY